MIRVLISADTATHLAALESTIRAAEPGTLLLVGSVIGRDRLSDTIEETNPDVLLEHGYANDSRDNAGEDDLPPSEFADSSLARVLLVSEPELADAIAAMRFNDAAIRGVLPEWSSQWEIRAAVEAVAEGLLALHPDFADRALVSAVPEPETELAGHALSPREREVLNLLAAGMANKEIAAHLNISAHTVKFHITSVFNKLNASSRAEAVAIGARLGLILL